MGPAFTATDLGYFENGASIPLCEPFATSSKSQDAHQALHQWAPGRLSSLPDSDGRLLWGSTRPTSLSCAPPPPQPRDLNKLLDALPEDAYAAMLPKINTILADLS